MACLPGSAAVVDLDHLHGPALHAAVGVHPLLPHDEAAEAAFEGGADDAGLRADRAEHDRLAGGRRGRSCRPWSRCRSRPWSRPAVPPVVPPAAAVPPVVVPSVARTAPPSVAGAAVGAAVLGWRRRARAMIVVAVADLLGDPGAAGRGEAAEDDDHEQHALLMCGSPFDPVCERRIT